MVHSFLAAIMPVIFTVISVPIRNSLFQVQGRLLSVLLMKNSASLRLHKLALHSETKRKAYFSFSKRC